MSEFVREYGKLLLVVIIIAGFIEMAFVMKNYSHDTAVRTSDSFTTLTDQQMDSIETDVNAD